MARFANTPTQAKSLVHNVEQALIGIGLYVNSDKASCMCFVQRGAISPLTCKPLALVDKFVYLSINILLTECDDMCIDKSWTVTYKLTFEFFQ